MDYGTGDPVARGRVTGCASRQSCTERAKHNTARFARDFETGALISAANQAIRVRRLPTN